MERKVSTIIDQKTIDELLMEASQENAQTSGKIISAMKQMQLENVERDRVLKRLANEQARMSELVNGLDQKVDGNNATVEKLNEDLNVLCSPVHASRKKALKKICKKKVHTILGDPTGCAYQVFSPFFFKIIYTDMASAMDVSHWDDINMKDFELEDSPYSLSKQFATNWSPNPRYVEAKLNQLITARDNGYLKPNRCRALTDYLVATNNGQFAPWN